ncbi:MAG: bifunctional diaminohydroxyphosphoribosylaminopyrimidine deaminase/5-amino-6-(5-phosphoribosylamino)uracil reductase RibD [Candidatus Acidiferrum sp.]
MELANSLARKGTGLASPNPLVGCVITTTDGQIIGEGFHQYDWRDHAEIVALKSAGEKSRGATLYVNLEPCNHAGRTGPCTEAIISAGIQRVFVGMRDPNPQVAGRGIERLRAAGIEVILAGQEEETVAGRINETFSYWICTGKPFVTLKSALTLDGQLALPKERGAKAPSWFTSEESRAEVHRMRHASDALLTGIGTILADNPLLNDRSGLPRRRHLLRVVLDSRLRLSPKSRIVQSAVDDLLVFTAESLKSPKARRLQHSGVEIVRAKSRRGRIDLHAVVSELGRRDILSVLLEGGPSLNSDALSTKLVQKLVLFYAPKLAGCPTVPFANGLNLIIPPLQSVSFKQLGPDFALEAYLHAAIKIS